MGNSARVMTIYDEPMWQSIERKQWSLQVCRQCGTVRYPPSPICAECHSMDYDWKPLAGGGTILSWVVFHRKYFDDFPPPYNAVAVRVDEGPIIVSNLVGREPVGSWIGHRVRLRYGMHQDHTVPQVELTEAD